MARISQVQMWSKLYLQKINRMDFTIEAAGIFNPDVARLPLVMPIWLVEISTVVFHKNSFHKEAV